MSEEPEMREPNITELQLRMDKNLERITNQLKEAIFTIQKPNNSVQFDADVGSTSKDKLTNVLSIKNPYKRTVLLKEIVIIPDGNFRSNGLLRIETNKVKVFSSTFGYFSDIGADNLVIPHGITLDRDEEVKFLIKNDDNITQIKISARVMFVT